MTGGRPPVCDYTGSDYQTSFWEQGGREYEDQAEGVALRRLLPRSGKLLLELGAGAGRNTPRYRGFERVVLLDFSHTQLEQAQVRLGRSERYVFVAADIYRLPFVPGLFDAATMIRTLHHMADAPLALRQIRQVLQPGGTFILEFANKRNLKAVLRYLLRRQSWSPSLFSCDMPNIPHVPSGRMRSSQSFPGMGEEASYFGWIISHCAGSSRNSLRLMTSIPPPGAWPLYINWPSGRAVKRQ